MLSLYDGELEFTEDMIRGDLRNNSAWNYRYSIIQDTTKFNPEVIEREIKFTIEKIKLAPNNESAWNYLKGYYSINSKGKKCSFSEGRPGVVGLCRCVLSRIVPQRLSCVSPPCLYGRDIGRQTFFEEGSDAARRGPQGKLWRSVNLLLQTKQKAFSNSQFINSRHANLVSSRAIMIMNEKTRLVVTDGYLVTREHSRLSVSVLKSLVFVCCIVKVKDCSQPDVVQTVIDFLSSLDFFLALHRARRAGRHDSFRVLELHKAPLYVQVRRLNLRTHAPASFSCGASAFKEMRFSSLHCYFQCWKKCVSLRPGNVR